MYETLEELGLTKNEIKIYLALLKHGQSTSGALFKETGIQASALYYGLSNLKKKGLVTHILISGRKNFQAASPQRLIFYAEEKRKAVEKVVPELEEIQNKETPSVQANVHEGYRSFKSIYDRILRDCTTKDMVYVFGARQSGDPTYKELNLLLKSYHNHREKKKIKTQVIYDADVKKEVLPQVKKWKTGKAKFLHTKTPVWVLIYHDRVINFMAEPRLIAIEITGKDVADSYKKFFELMWKSALE